MAATGSGAGRAGTVMHNLVAPGRKEKLSLFSFLSFFRLSFLLCMNYWMKGLFNIIWNFKDCEGLGIWLGDVCRCGQNGRTRRAFT